MLVLQFISQFRRIKNGRGNTGRGRVFLNWLLVLIVIGGFGGGIYLAHQPKQEVAQPVKTTTPTTTKESDDKVNLEFDRKVELNDEGERKVKFNVSPGTKVKIVGHYSRTVFKTVNNKTEFTYTFDQPGTYDIIATKGDKKVVKKLVVKDYSDDDSSSEDSSSDSSSSSSSNSSSSRASSSSSNNNSNSSNSSRSQSNGGSSASNSNGGSSNSNYRGGSGSSYRGGGNSSYRGNYTPSRPAVTPSPAPSNGTGAMTGGNY